jgi:Flp pilus assembly protein TadG
MLKKLKMFQLIHKNYRCLLSGPLSFPRWGADPCLGFEAMSAAAANRVTVTERRRLAAFGVAARFMCDPSGNSGDYAVMFALMAPIVIGTLTLGTETGLWYSTQETIQGAANSSAISAAVGINAGNTNAALQADAVAASNGFVNDANGTTVTVN